MFDLDVMVFKVDLWVYGYIYDLMDYWLGKVRVVCNFLGYFFSDLDGVWF